MASKMERFELRIDSDMLEKLDAWRDEEFDEPNRSEAARRLIQIGLNSSDRQGYMNMKMQVKIAAVLDKKKENISDAYLFAWANDVYPVLNSTAERWAKPFAHCFYVTESMMDTLAKHIDDLWLQKQEITFYDLEEGFGPRGWHRVQLIDACRYLCLTGRFRGFWEPFMAGVGHPVEAKDINTPYKREEDLFIA